MRRVCRRATLLGSKDRQRAKQNAEKSASTMGFCAKGHMHDIWMAETKI
jgi:hypothetical protein